MSSPLPTPYGGPRVIVCDYNALLQSVTGLLRMSGCAVFQAYDGQAAVELCKYMPEIGLLVLNTEGTGMDTPALVEAIRGIHPRLPVLHVGKAPIPGMPEDVLDLADSFRSDELLAAVRQLLPDWKV